jgi:hypothetical protein
MVADELILTGVELDKISSVCSELGKWGRRDGSTVSEAVLNPA